MSWKVRQHIPPFVDGVEPKEAEFTTVEDLLAVPFVAAWKEGPGFFRYSISPLGIGRANLMAEFEGGTVWWVIGVVNGGCQGLPIWEPRDRRPPS